MKKLFIICLGVSVLCAADAFSAAMEETKYEDNPYGHPRSAGKVGASAGEVLMEGKMDVTRVMASAEEGKDWAIVEMFERSLSSKKIEEAVEWAMKGFGIDDIFYTLVGHNPRIGQKDIPEEERRRLIEEYIKSIIRGREEPPFKG